MNEDSLLKISKSDIESCIKLYESANYPQALFFFQQSVEKVTKYIGLKLQCIEESELQKKIKHDPVEVFRLYISKVASDPNRILPIPDVDPHSFTNIKQKVKTSSEAECIDATKSQIEEILNEPLMIDEKKNPIDAVSYYFSMCIDINKFGLDDQCLKKYLGLMPKKQIEEFIMTINYGIPILQILLFISLVISKYRIDDFRYPSEKIDDPSDYFNSVNPLVKNLPYFIRIMKEIVLKFSGEIEWSVDNK